MSIMDISNCNFHIDEVKECLNRVRTLTQRNNQRSERLRLAVTDRIFGKITTDELMAVIEEAKKQNDELTKAKIELRQWRNVLSDIDSALGHVLINASCSETELDSEINVGMIFSDVEKMKGVSDG